MNSHILSRRDTILNWTVNNPIPLDGEICIEKDTNRIKIGNGILNYNSLPYFGNPVAPSNEFAIFQETTNVGTNGTLLTGVNTKRLLNTKKINTITGCTLNTLNSSFTLPVGSYLIEGNCVSNPGQLAPGFHGIWPLDADFDFDVPLVQGTNSTENHRADYNRYTNETNITLSGIITLTEKTELGLFYLVTIIGTTFPLDGVCGVTRNSGPGVNVYATLKITKLS